MDTKSRNAPSLQHVQLPNNMTVGTDLSPKDLLIYACIKKHQNKTTKTCYPSIETIMKLSSSSKPTVMKAIENLKRLKYIEVTKEGRKNVYHFNPYKDFEPFSPAFLEKEDVPANLKAYVIATQQYMFKDIDGYGKVTFTDQQLANTINLSYNTITKYNKALVDMGYLDIVKTNTRDKVTGLQINEKIFHLNELEQAIVFKLQEHENRLDKSEMKIDTMELQVGILLKENREIKEELDRLKNPDKYTEIIM